MSSVIVNNRIAGTRITVWDIVHYLEGDAWSPSEIAHTLNLSLDQIQSAVAYIEENKQEVMRVHHQIEERIRRGNPPEVEARREISRAKLCAELEKRNLMKKVQTNGSWHHGGQ